MKNTSANRQRLPADDHTCVWYELFVRSYCDSNGDGIGDLPGVLSKLDELAALGVGGIWLLPIHPSSSYHKYNVADYYAIDPAYGTMRDFEQLLAACHARGLRLILDLVLNHSADEHPWFLRASHWLAAHPEADELDLAACPSLGYYNFVRAEVCPPFHYRVPGTEHWCYEGHFDAYMPDFNFGSPALREELRRIMEFWLNKGVDGFRLDAAAEYYSGEPEKNVEVLHWIKTEAEAIKPGCFLVAEVWQSAPLQAVYYRSGIGSMFDFPFGNREGEIMRAIHAAGRARQVARYAEASEQIDRMYRSADPEYRNAPFLSNHDMGRIADFAGHDVRKMKLACAMNLFMSGAAFLYYGEELGMHSAAPNDPSYRAPMLWGGGEAPTQPPPGCTLPKSYPLGTLYEQKQCPDSVYQYYVRAIALRNRLPVLSHGRPFAETRLHHGCVSAIRKVWGSQECLVLFNINDSSAQVDLDRDAGWTLEGWLSAEGQQHVLLRENALHLPPFAAAVLVK